jgi:hypothetical protein
MEGRIAGASGQSVERGWLLRRLDQLQRRLDRGGITADVVGLAAKAGAKPGRRRFRAVGEEADILALRVASGAGRAAIDTGGENAGDEAAVHGAVASEDGGPGGVRLGG